MNHQMKFILRSTSVPPLDMLTEDQMKNLLKIEEKRKNRTEIKTLENNTKIKINSSHQSCVLL